MSKQLVYFSLPANTMLAEQLSFLLMTGEADLLTIKLKYENKRIQEHLQLLGLLSSF